VYSSEFEPLDIKININVIISLHYEMGGARGAYGGGEKCAQGSGGET
jgi:hypothetical protein